MPSRDGGGATWDNPSSTDGAQFVTLSTSAKTIEEKAAKRLIDSAGHMTFEVSLFAYAVTVIGREVMQERLLDIATSIISTLAQMHTTGASRTKATQRAARMHDNIGSI